MGERRLMAASARADGHWWVPLLVLAVQLACPGVGTAAVTVRASLNETLYSTDADPDCSELHKLNDQGTGGAELPLNIVRLHASVPGVPDEEVSFRWSMRKPEFGVLAADQDIAGGNQLAVIQGICAEFGNACVLSGERLRFYSQSSILWVAPTCDVLPTNTAKQFRGGRARFKVKAMRGSRRLGRGTIEVGFGRVASLTLFANGQTGLRKPSGIPVGVRVFFSANTDPGGFTLPAVKSYEFANGAGSSAPSDGPCSIDGRPFEACAGLRGELDYNAPGKYLATVEQVFADDSALCDNVTVQVLACAARGDVQIVRRPRLPAYIPGDARKGTVDVVVRLRNRSRAEGGLPPCGFLLSGPNVLSCSEEVRFRGGSDTKDTQFDLRHCSESEDIACDFNAQCPDGETCLREPHCSKTLTRSCKRDDDCEKPACDNCEDDEKCIRVLEISGDLVVDPGHSIDLLTLDDVPLINVLPDTATLTDTWTANTVNAGSYDGTDKYRIKGRPNVPPR